MWEVRLCVNRRVIAAAVAGDPETYSEAFLGRPNADYCRWILGMDKWGGAIELSILSRCAHCPMHTANSASYALGKDYVGLRHLSRPFSRCAECLTLAALQTLSGSHRIRSF